MAEFGYCLNTSTIRGQALSLPREIALTAGAGYQGIEPWVRELDAYVAEGGNLADIRAQCADAGLEIVNLIGFFAWAADDDAERAAGVAEARRSFALAQEVGATMVAAPPMGLSEATDLRRVGAHYRALLEIGRAYGVTPVLEFWGMSKVLGRLSDALFVAAEADHDDACVLADVFHMYKSGAEFHNLHLLGPRTLGLFHVNDYPADPPRDVIKDAERVYPGDGVAPSREIYQTLRAIGYRGMLSVELFNPAYYAQPAEVVAATALAKIKAVAE